MWGWGGAWGSLGGGGRSGGKCRRPLSRRNRRTCPCRSGFSRELLASVPMRREKLVAEAAPAGPAGCAPATASPRIACSCPAHGTPRLQCPSIPLDRKSVVYGKSVSVRVDLGGRRIFKKKNTLQIIYNT